MSDSFYEPDRDAYFATEDTRGPWDPGPPPAGPPAARPAPALARLGAGRMGGGEGAPAQIGRITYEILRSVPIARLRVEAEIEELSRRISSQPAHLGRARGTLNALGTEAVRAG